MFLKFVQWLTNIIWEYVAYFILMGDIFPFLPVIRNMWIQIGERVWQNLKQLYLNNYNPKD